VRCALDVSGGALDVSGSVNATTLYGNGNGIKNPVFCYVQSAPQSITAASETKVSLDTPVFDNFSYWNSTSKRWIPQVAGYYQVNGSVMIANNPSLANGNVVYCIVYKNGSNYARGNIISPDSSNNAQSTTSCIVNMNGTSDYLELYVYSESGGHSTVQNSAYTFMSGALVSN